MINPFIGLLFFVGGLCLLPVISRLKSNLEASGQFNDLSFEAGMVCMLVIVLILLGTINAALWLFL